MRFGAHDAAGLHTGVVITDASGDLFGRHGNKAAPIAGPSAGCQILVGGTVLEIAVGSHAVELGSGVEVVLKGLDGTHRARGVLAEQLGRRPTAIGRSAAIYG